MSHDFYIDWAIRDRKGGTVIFNWQLQNYLLSANWLDVSLEEIDKHLENSKWVRKNEEGQYIKLETILLLKSEHDRLLSIEKKYNETQNVAGPIHPTPGMWATSTLGGRKRGVPLIKVPPSEDYIEYSTFLSSSNSNSTTQAPEAESHSSPSQS